MEKYQIVLIVIASAILLIAIILGIIGLIVANKTAKEFGYTKKALLKATLLGIFCGNYLIVKSNFDKIEIVLQGENFYFQQNKYYTLYTSRYYAKKLKQGYYKNTTRTVRGLDYELAAHYLFYIIKNKHAVDGSYLGTDFKVDKSAKLFEIISKFLP